MESLKRKGGFCLLILAVISLFCVEVYASDISYLNFDFTGNECIVIGCDKEAKGVITVPETVSGKPVTKIAANAFSECIYLTEINLPETVRSIGNSAFSICTSLEAFDMPDSVEVLGKAAFSMCYSLRSVNLSQSLNTVPEEAFYMCGNLNDVEISEDTTLFGKNAFKDCSSMKYMVLPGKTSEIFAGCFSGCSSLERIYFPSSVAIIETGVFEKCKALKDVYYQGNNKSFAKILISSGNDILTNSNLVFNHNHKNASTVTTYGATCLEDGYKTYDCICGHFEISDYTTAKGHDLTEYFKIYDSDCVSNGLAYLKCKNCTFYEEITLALRDHSPVTDAAVKSTCIKTGLTEGSHCSVCDKILLAQKTVPFAAHTYTKKITDNAHLASPATYTVAAKYYYSCEICNAVSKDKTYSGSKLALGKTNKFISSSTGNSITLGWNKVSGASGYAIYYKNASGVWKLYKKVTDNILKISGLSAGKLYEFAVRAYVIEKNTLVLAPSYVTLKEATQPVAPSKITAKQNEKAIQLNWTASAGATHYQLYYYNGSQKKWILYKDNITARSYTFYNLRTGVAYRFAVRPYINTGVKKVIGSSYIAITTSTKPASPILKSTPLKASVRLNWVKISGADGYIIYGSASPNSGYKKLTTTTSLTYTKAGLASGKTYYFRAFSYKNTPSGVVYSYAGTVKAVTTK